MTFYVEMDIVMILRVFDKGFKSNVIKCFIVVIFIVFLWSLSRFSRNVNIDLIGTIFHLN